MKRLAQLCLLLTGLLTLLPALALDVMTLEDPTPLTDQKVTIGGRTLNLPEGNWVYVGKSLMDLSFDGRRSTQLADVYLVKIKDKKLQASIFLRMPVGSLNSGQPAGLVETPCDRTEGYDHKEAFSRSRSSPACYFVYARDNHLKSDIPLFQAAKAWLDLEKIEISAPFSVSAYSKWTVHDSGAIYVFLPLSNNHSLETLAKWGGQLHKNLEYVFERRSDSGTVPALP